MNNNNNILGEINTSLLESLDNIVSKEEYIERLKSLLNPILQQRFKDSPIKQQIYPHKDRLTISCPICGDSMINPNKKRGNFILEGKHRGFYKCFNCSAFKRIDLFFKDYNVDLDLDIINYISNNLGDFSFSESSNIDTSMLLDFKSLEGYAIERQDLKEKLNLCEVIEYPVSSWLRDRLQFQFERFLYDPKDKNGFILNLTPGKKIIGAQLRILYPRKNQSRFLTFKLSKLYEILNITKEIPDDIDTISQIFKISEININLPVTLFEGPMDAFLFKNSIANAGLNKSLPLNIPIRYFYDDDNDGRKKTISKLENSEPVFLWTKFKNDYNLPERKKWDYNDALIWLKHNNIKMPIFNNYFSNDPLDLIDI